MDEEAKKYVCTSKDLDKLLPDGRDGLPNLKKQFQDLFSDNWRLYYVPRKEYASGMKREPNESDDDWKDRLRQSRDGKRIDRFNQFFARFDIDWVKAKDETEEDRFNPTVRDAVAFDLVKLDDESVSNDNVYRYKEHQNYSPMEYERYLLNRNYRINLVNLDPDRSNIKYGEDEQTSTDYYDAIVSHTKEKPTVVKMFQGPRISKTLLEYFSQVMEVGKADGIYVPFTNANDFSIEVSLIPNTHPDFRQITSRAYYDTQWAKYKRLLAKFHISAISTFALVDPKKDKNHTGEYLVKIQRDNRLDSNNDLEERYTYLAAKVDKDGQIVEIVNPWNSNNNTTLCVCKQDICQFDDYGNMVSADRETGDTSEWNPYEPDEHGNPKGIRDIPMVHSTTSSHYSIFRQRVPDYDLKLVRHYLQFKNRLEGMELCLEQVKRDVHHKEVRSGDCFAKLTMVMKRLMDEFSNNKELMDLVKKYYDLYAEWDKLTAKKVQMNDLKDGKIDLLRQLQDEYNALGNNQLDKKLALGQKIGSLKLELDKSIEESLQSIQDRLGKIVIEMNEVNNAIEEINRRNPDDWHLPEETSARISSEIWDERWTTPSTDPTVPPKLFDKMKSKMSAAIDGIRDKINNKSKEDKEDLVPDMSKIEDWDVPSPREGQSSSVPSIRAERSNNNRPALETLDTRRLHRLIVQSERWRNYSFNIGYELSQFKKMLTMCDDATIKVRRLLHNFEEKIKDTQEQVWDKDYNLRSDFDFKDISVAGLRDIILLHDWWAANAPNAKPTDMGMTDEQFMAFRRRCNKISYNLRKNQYAQLLAVKRDRSERRISELEDIIKDKKTLHWNDKYGKDAIRDEGEEKWSVEKANAKARETVRLLAMAQDIIDESEDDDDKERSVSPTKETLRRKVASFVDVELEDEDNSNRIISPSKDDLKKRKISSFIDVELEDEDHSTGTPVPTKRQLARRKIVESVVNEETTYRECVELEKQYKDDSKKLVKRTVDYLKNLGLIESEADIERLATLNSSSHNPEISRMWIDDIQQQKKRLDSAIELMHNQRKSMQSIIDNVAKMEGKIKELKEKNKRIFDICMKSGGKKVKGVDRQVRNRMLMDKLDNEQRMFELKQMVKKAKSQHFEDFSSLEKMRKDVDEKQSTYDQKVRSFKSDIGLTTETIDNLMVGIYNEFQDEILEHNNKGKRK